MSRIRTSSSSNGRTRLSLALPAETAARLARVVEASESETATEAIKRALTCFERLMVHVSGGGRILLERDGEKTVELELL